MNIELTKKETECLQGLLIYEIETSENSYHPKNILKKLNTQNKNSFKNNWSEQNYVTAIQELLKDKTVTKEDKKIIEEINLSYLYKEKLSDSQKSRIIELYFRNFPTRNLGRMCK